MKRVEKVWPKVGVELGQKKSSPRPSSSSVDKVLD